MITSKSNPKIRNIRKLLSSSKERRNQGVFIIEGSRLLKEAPAESIRELYMSESYAKSGEADPEAYPEREIVSDDVFRFLSDTVHPQGVLAVVRQPSVPAEPDPFSGPCNLLLLDDIQDPGNLGTILRTAEAAGVDMVFLSEGCADMFNPKVIRSTMGSIFRVPFVSDDLVAVIEDLKAEGITVYGAALTGAVDYREIEVPERRAIVIGNEGNGISKPVLNALSGTVKIPMEGKVESLNAAVSAAILLYHFKKSFS